MNTHSGVSTKVDTGVIIPKIRGTGIVKANETYDVTLKESRR